MQTTSLLPHVSSLALLPFTAAFAGAAALSHEPPRALIEAAIQAHYPHTVGLDLAYEARPCADGSVEVRCKVRRQLTEPTFELVHESGESCTQAVVAECLRVGLLEAAEAERIRHADAWEPVTRFDPRFEPKLRGIDLLREVQPIGTIFEVCGILRAERFVDVWEMAGFQPRRRQPGLTLLEAHAEIAMFQFEPVTTYVLGTPEWEELLASLQPVRAARVARMEKADAALREALRPGSVFHFQLQSRSGRALLARAELAGEPGGPATVVELSLPNARPTTRRYEIAPELRRGRPERGFQKFAQRFETYRNAPDESPEAELRAATGPGATRGGGLARLGDRLALRLEPGGLVLIDRSAPSANSAYLLLPDSGGAATAAARVACEDVAWQRH